MKYSELSPRSHCPACQSKLNRNSISKKELNEAWDIKYDGPVVRFGCPNFSCGWVYKHLYRPGDGKLIFSVIAYNGLSMSLFVNHFQPETTCQVVRFNERNEFFEDVELLYQIKQVISLDLWDLNEVKKKFKLIRTFN